MIRSFNPGVTLKFKSCSIRKKNFHIFLQSSRQLQLTISRSGGSIGTIAVDYSIIYLPPGVSDPLQGSTGVVAPAMGSIQIQDGQSSVQFSVPLMSDAFLEEGSSFFVQLDNTTLIGGGELMLS